VKISLKFFVGFSLVIYGRFIALILMDWIAGRKIAIDFRTFVHFDRCGNTGAFSFIQGQVQGVFSQLIDSQK